MDETCVSSAVWYCTASAKVLQYHTRHAKAPIHILAIFYFCLATVFDDCNSKKQNAQKRNCNVYCLFFVTHKLSVTKKYKRHCILFCCVNTLQVGLLSAVCRASCRLPLVSGKFYICAKVSSCVRAVLREKAKGGGSNRIEATCARARHTHTHTHVVAGGISVAQTHGDGSGCDDSIWVGHVAGSKTIHR